MMLAFLMLNTKVFYYKRILNQHIAEWEELGSSLIFFVYLFIKRTMGVAEF